VPIKETIMVKRSSKRGSGSDKAKSPSHEGGDAIRKAQQWSGGSKGSKGGVTKRDRRNPNASAKT
jgi:hypothetical protein